MGESRAMTIRLTDVQHAALESIAATEGKTVSGVIREAIDGHIECRRQDPAFQARLVSYRANQEAIYRRLVA